MAQPQDNENALLTLNSVSKNFGGTQALSDVSVTFERGKVHALIGENGAGKSTLGKLALGIHQPDGGRICLKGQDVHITNPAHALRLGLVGIAQELSLMPNSTVGANIALGREVTRGPFVNDKATRRAVLDVMDKYDMHLDPDIITGNLPVAEQQKVEILRALSRDAELIVFDEPTARLASHQARQLLELVKLLAKSGKAIIYVSHFLEEVLDVSDTITVLRNGKWISTSAAENETKNSLIQGVTGKAVQNQFPPLPDFDPKAPPYLRVTDLSRQGQFEGVSFDIRPGEILGLAGLVGAGRSEIAQAIYGATQPHSGKIEFCGADATKKSVAQALQLGMAMVPESRRDQGLMLARPILENTSLPYLEKFNSLFGLNKTKERREVIQRCGESQVKYGSLNDHVDTLSGGNQQKILFARAAIGKPKLLIADEPTRGVDVGAKRGIYDLIVELANSGEAILLISSEIEEIMGLCHRVIVMSRGKVTAELTQNEITQEAVMQAAFSGV